MKQVYNFLMNGQHRVRFAESSESGMTVGVFMPPAGMSLDTNQYFIVIDRDSEGHSSRHLISILGHQAFLEYQSLLADNCTDKEALFLDTSLSADEDAPLFVDLVSKTIKKVTLSEVYCDAKGQMIPASFFTGEYDEVYERYAARINGLQYQLLKSGKPAIGPVLIQRLTSKLESCYCVLFEKEPQKEPEVPVEVIQAEPDVEVGENFSLF